MGVGERPHFVGFLNLWYKYSQVGQFRASNLIPLNWSWKEILTLGSSARVWTISTTTLFSPGCDRCLWFEYFLLSSLASAKV